MEIEAFIAYLRHSLPGQPIRFFRYAANSLMVYLGCTPEDLGRKVGDPGYVIWLEPTWHVCSLKDVLVGSREAQIDPEGGEPNWDRLIGLLNPLLGKRVEAVTTDFLSNDLVLIVEGGYLIRTFVSDAQSDHLWHIDDNARRIALYADPRGFELVEREDAEPAAPADQPPPPS
jgi:hypothetical protein